MIEAILNGDEEEALRVLAHPGFSGVTVSDPAGMTALHHAARGGYVQVVKELLHREPSLSQVFTSATRTPAHWLPLHCVSDAPSGGKNQVMIVRSPLRAVFSSIHAGVPCMQAWQAGRFGEYNSGAVLWIQYMTFMPSLVCGPARRGSYSAGLGVRVGCRLSAGCTLALRARCVSND